MNAMFAILSVQALLGAFDNLWHHELEAKLPSNVSARYELLLHAAREAIYGVLFLAFAWLECHGRWAWALAALLAAEIFITLADFIEEDMTRRLPPLERVLHTILALGYGAFVMALAPILADWSRAPTSLAYSSHGWASWLFTAFAAGVLAWSLRNAIAVLRLYRSAEASPPSRHARAVGGPAVLVTGATGFIGTALTHRLLADGGRVIVLTRDARRAAATFRGRVQSVENLDDIPAETPIEAVVNLAGASIAGGYWTARRKALLLGSRKETTRKIVALMARLDRTPSVLVSASAIGFYGVERSEPTLDENATTQPGNFQSDLCAAWEAEADRARDLGVRVIKLRLAVVLGRSGGMFPPLVRATRLGLGAILGDGAQPAAWVHLDDAIGLIQFAIDMPAVEGAVNAAAPQRVSQADFARAIGRAVGGKPHLKIPRAVLLRLAGEAAQLLLDGQAVAPRAAQAAGYRFVHPTLESALADLAAPSARPQRGADSLTSSASNPSLRS